MGFCSRVASEEIDALVSITPHFMGERARIVVPAISRWHIRGTQEKRARSKTFEADKRELRQTLGILSIMARTSPFG